MPGQQRTVALVTCTRNLGLAAQLAVLLADPRIKRLIPACLLNLHLWSANSALQRCFFLKLSGRLEQRPDVHRLALAASAWE